MQALVVPDPVLTQVNRILFRFLWRKKDCYRKAFEKVKRTVVCSALENGGLNNDRFKTDACSVLAAVGWTAVPSAGAR